jgi:diadenosine tetraphosphate (Ap4A) HIT family hydrolase
MIHLGAAEAKARAAAESTSWPNGCAMCAVVAEPRHVLAENAHALCVLDRYAARRAHLIVVHRRHVEAIADLPYVEYEAMQRLAWEACRAVAQALRPVRTYVASLGSATKRTISFPHTHVHVLPLYDGDERDRPALVLTWSNGVFIYEPGEAESLAADLRAAWPR